MFLHVYPAKGQTTHAVYLHMTQIFIMHERANLAKSKYKAWIEALPVQIHSAVSFTDDEISELQDEEAESVVKGDRLQTKNDFQDLRRSVFSRHPKAFPQESYTWKKYLWARLMVDSRCWSLQGKRLCVPGADFFNYGVSEEQLEPNSDLNGHFFVDYHKKGFHEGKETVDIFSDRDCAAGEQLFEAYGESQ